MPRLRSGNLRRRFAIQSASEAQDSLGSINYSWSTDATRWGSIEQLTADERKAHGQLQGSNTVKIVMRYYAGLTIAERLKVGGPDGYIKFSAPNASKTLTLTPLNTDAFYRATDGAGPADAWTIAVRFKAPSGSTASSQTILHYGQLGVGTAWMRLYYDGLTEKVYLHYGTDTEFLLMSVPVLKGTWQHLIVTYDGGSTANEDFERFTFWVNGIVTASIDFSGLGGWDGTIPVSAFRIGSSATLGQEVALNFSISQLAIWESDQTANVTDIYNGGIPTNLTSLDPQSQWLFEDVVDITSIVDTEDYKDILAAGFVSSNFIPPTGVYNIVSLQNEMERNHVTSVIAVEEL